MISRYQDLYRLVMPELPGCQTPLVLQTLQAVGRSFCRNTECWTERLSMNLVDDQKDYVLSPNYDVDIIRPWKVWTSGTDVDSDPLDPSYYDFAPGTNTLTFHTAPQGYTNATAWAADTEYSDGDEVSNGNKTYEATEDHTSDSSSFAVDLAAGKWTDVTDDLIVKAILIPRLFTTELAGWFMEKWAEALAAGTKAMLMGQYGKKWSNPRLAADLSFDYDRFMALARREKFTEHKNQPLRVTPQSWL